MNFNSKRSVTDEQNERHKRILASVLKEEGNKSCADCRTRNPTWASVNLGVFVCLTCSGIHRSLGVHISQVRSCNLDTWLPKQVEFCRIMGNVKGNRYWEARLPKDFRRPPSGNPNPELAAFIRAKYVDRAYAATDAAPPTIDNHHDHPYVGEDRTSSAAAAPPAATPVAPAQAPSAAARRLAPTKASASSPALTIDLLGGFDDITSSSAPGFPTSPTPTPTNATATAANSDPFSYGSFVSAPPPAPATTATSNGSSSTKRVSLEWGDFFAAAPVAPAAPAQPAALQHTLLHVQASNGHHRSHSISEGVISAPTGALSAPASSQQPSRLGNGKAGPPSAGPQHTRTLSHPESHNSDKHHHHHHHHHKQADSQQQQQQQPAVPPSSQLLHAVGSDPFASLIVAPSSSPAEDLLAGLTIHHVMESMTPTHEDSAPSSSTGYAAQHQHQQQNHAGGTAAASGSVASSSAGSGAFQFSSSALPGDHKPAARGHKRHPSNMKSSEEILRLFDTEPSTGAAAGSGGCGGPGGGAAAGGFDDGFGDFLGAVSKGVAVAENGVGGGCHQHGKMHGLQPHVNGCDTGAPFGLGTTGAMVPNLL